jgi:hypothetical protein
MGAPNLYELLRGSEMEAMAEINPELADAFMAIAYRIMMFCDRKHVKPKDVAITGPNFVNGKAVFTIKYGKLNPETCV